MKRCNNCGLSIDEGAIFGKNKKSKDGLCYRCKKCHCKRTILYYQSENGIEYRRKYKQTKRYRESQKKYWGSSKGQKSLKNYWESRKGKETRKKYKYSEKGRKVAREYYEKNKIIFGISTLLRRSLKGNKNGHHWEDLVGWTLQQFKNRFNQLFKPGMTWENHGAVWEIDHIQPLSVHNITSIDCTDFKRAWQLSNLQPLFKEENRSKSNNLEKHFQPTLF
jgi:hypothetical protein